MKKIILISASTIAVAAIYAVTYQSEKPIPLSQSVSQVSTVTMKSPEQAPQDTNISHDDAPHEISNESTSQNTIGDSPTHSEKTTATVDSQEADKEVEDVNNGSWFSAQQPNPEEVAKTREERRQQLAAQLDNLLTTESNDVTWQNTISQQAQDALNLLPSLNGITVSSTFCSDTLCKMTLSAKDQEIFAQMRGVAAGIGLFLGSDAWGHSNHDALLTDVYISRPGETLPFI